MQCLKQSMNNLILQHNGSVIFVNIKSVNKLLLDLQRIWSFGDDILFQYLFFSVSPSFFLLERRDHFI